MPIDADAPIDEPPRLTLQASLGYKLILGLVGLVAVWVVVGLAVDRLMADSPWRTWLTIAVPLAISAVAGVWLIRRLRQRFEELFAAADRLARGDWETEVRLPGSGRFGDETDVMLHQLERIRRNTQHMLGEINEAGQRVHTSSVGLSQTAQDIYHDIGTFSNALESLRRGAEDQATMTEEMQQGMDGVSRDAQQHRQVAEDTEATSEEIRQKILEDGKKMEAVLGDWERSLDDLRSTGTEIENFEETAREIGSVVGIIAEVAQRTHTLSLNASLEAVRAGDEGEGFAVLAVEIRSLAEDTARRAEAIDDLLQRFIDQQRTLLSQLWRGVSGMDENRQAVGTIRTRMQDILAGIETVAVRIVRLARGFGALDERIAFMRSQAANVHKISGQHAQMTRETVSESRDQMLMGADQLLHEGRNLDRIARDLNRLVQELQERPAP